MHKRYELKLFLGPHLFTVSFLLNAISRLSLPEDIFGLNNSCRILILAKERFQSDGKKVLISAMRYEAKDILSVEMVSAQGENLAQFARVDILTFFS